MYRNDTFGMDQDPGFCRMHPVAAGGGISQTRTLTRICYFCIYKLTTRSNINLLGLEHAGSDLNPIPLLLPDFLGYYILRILSHDRVFDGQIPDDLRYDSEQRHPCDGSSGGQYEVLMGTHENPGMYRGASLLGQRKTP